MDMLSLLQVAFIVLKVLDKIDWSWWVVFIPTYCGVGIFICVMYFYDMIDPTIFRSRRRKK